MDIHQATPVLTPDGPAIRLLKLDLKAPECDSPLSAIHGTLAAHATDAAPSYEALSYTWGYISKTIPIMLNNTEFAIPLTLHEGLLHILQRNQDHHAKTCSHLWVDSICINQEDTAEKSAQVSRMRDIYAQAERVLIWLGPADKYTSSAFDTLRKFAADDGTKDGSRTLAELESTRNERQIAVEKFIQRPWFSRMWVIQEVVVSREATIHCGADTMDWDDVYLGLQRATGSGFMPFSEQVNRATSIGIWREKFHIRRDSHVRAEDLDMRLIMMDEGVKKATDLRDKIYSLRGLASDKFAEGIVVDYRDTIEKVYTDSTKHLLRIRKDLRILSRVRQRGKNPSLRLPSWVPDWDLGDPGGVLNRYYRFDPGKRFCASSRDFYRIVVPAEGDMIQVFGIHIDKIQRVYGIRSLFPHLGAYELTVNESKLRSLAKRFNLSDQNGTTGEENWIALFRTLTADRTPLSGRINDEYRRKYFAHIDVTASQDDGGKRKITEAAWAKVSPLLENIVDGKVFYITENGYLGFAEESCQKGDDVYVFCGGEVPFIVRLIGEGLFAFHGETYVHGLMDGEVMQWKNLKLEQSKKKGYGRQLVGSNALATKHALQYVMVTRARR